MASKYELGEIAQARILVNNATEMQWFQHLLDCATAMFFPKTRIKFIDTQGNASGAPLQGQVIIYMGANVDAFYSAFKPERKVVPVNV